MVEASELKIDPEFSALCPRQSDDELRILEESLIENGCLTAVIAWRGQNIILDGMTRYEICTRNGIGFGIRELTMTSRADAIEFIIRNQLGRRNLSAEQRRYLLGKRLTLQRPLHAGEVQQVKERIAAEEGVSRGTVERAEKFAEAVDQAAAKVPEVKPVLLSGTVDAVDVPAVAEAEPEVLRELAATPPEEQRQVAKEIAWVDRVREPEPDVLRDASGNVVPDALRMVFLNDRPCILGWMKEIASIRNGLEQLVKEPGGAFVDWLNLKKDLTNVHAALKFARPHAVCPYCGGSGCKACNDSGWVNEAVWKQAPKKEREREDRNRGWAADREVPSG